MTVDFVYQLMQDICSKNQSGYITPDNFNRWINQAQFSYLTYLYGEVQQFQPGRPVAKVEIGLSGIVRQILTPFIGPPVTLTVDGTGLSPYPSDLQRIDAIYTADKKVIKFIQQDRLTAYLESRIDIISLKPVYLIQDNGFQFYPITITSPQLSYVKKPSDIVWGFNNNPNGDPIYDPAQSTDPLWYDVDMMDIIARALKIAGVNLQSGPVSQYAEQLKQVGQ